MIICLGTTPAIQRTMTFDRLIVDGVNRATRVHLHAAGKSSSAGRVLKTIGEDPLCCGIVGGEPGKFIRDDLDRAGIAHDFVESGVPTRTCVTVIDSLHHTATELIEEPQPLAPELFERVLEKLAGRIKGAQGLVLSGVIAPGARDDFYARCTQLARSNNVPVIIDAKGAWLKLALKEQPTVVKPNRAELADTIGASIDSDDALRDAMREIVGMGALSVVVSNGAADTIVFDGQSFHRIPSPKVQVVNPIGSGDSMAAGLASGIVRGWSIADSAKLGVACAAANAMTMDSGFVDRATVELLLKEITVSQP